MALPVMLAVRFGMALDPITGPWGSCSVRSPSSEVCWGGLLAEPSLMPIGGVGVLRCLMGPGPGVGTKATKRRSKPVLCRHGAESTRGSGPRRVRFSDIGMSPGSVQRATKVEPCIATSPESPFAPCWECTGSLRSAEPWSN